MKKRGKTATIINSTAIIIYCNNSMDFAKRIRENKLPLMFCLLLNTRQMI